MRNHELNAADPEPIAAPEQRALDALAVHESAIRALEIDHFELRRARGEPAVQPRNERRIDDEVGAGRAPDRLDVAWQDPEREREVGVLSGSQHPHWSADPLCGHARP